MDNPCKHCNKANKEKYRYELLKCEKPCNQAKQWKKCTENLIDILCGKPLTEVMRGK